VAPEQFRRGIVGNKFKFDSNELGNENSEDAVSWNVWRSLYETMTIGANITAYSTAVGP